MPGVDDIVQKLRTKLRYARKPLPIDTFISIAAIVDFHIKLCDIDRTEIAGIIEMELLFTAWITSQDRSHRGHHVIVAVDLVDKDNTRLGVFMGRSDYTIPNV